MMEKFVLYEKVQARTCVEKLCTAMIANLN